MSLIAGIFSLNGSPPAEALRLSIVKSLSRTGDQIETYDDGRLFLAKIDIGAYGSSGSLRNPDGSVTLITGEPLLGRSSRAVDLTRLHRELGAGNMNVLRESRGVFSLVHYRGCDGRLLLASDKLGIRPLYIWSDKDSVVFASALRIIESAPGLHKSPDLQAAAETIALGFPLGQRTLYREVLRIGAAEIMNVTAAGVDVSTYWRWDELPVTQAPSIAALDNAFRDAIDIRQRGDREAVAFLSGGMDSRAIVGLLRKQGTEVHTFSLGQPDSQDGAFAAGFAEAAGTTHTSVRIRDPFRPALYSASLADSWLPTTHRHRVERPHLVWSGDGGSVGLGHVYMNVELVNMVRHGNLAGAARAFLQQQGAVLPRRLFRKSVAAKICGMPYDGVLSECATVQAADRGRSFHIFLMLNDQRRHLTSHFEHLDEHRVEFQLPFFDSAFLELILAAPVDEFLNHALYNRWFQFVGDPVSSVPWQTYPGHEPCPIPAPAGLGYQWAKTTHQRIRRMRTNRLVRQAQAALRSQFFPASILRRTMVQLAITLCRTNLRDHSYVLKSAVRLHDLNAACEEALCLPKTRIPQQPVRTPAFARR
jgi:hypothetical protein